MSFIIFCWILVLGHNFGTVHILGSHTPGSRQNQRTVCRKFAGEHHGIDRPGPVTDRIRHTEKPNCKKGLS